MMCRHHSRVNVLLQIKGCLKAFQAAFYLAKTVCVLKIRTRQWAGFRLAVLTGGAIKGDAHHLVALFFSAGKAVDGELQRIKPRYKRAAMIYVQAAGDGFKALAAILALGGAFKAHVGAAIT